MIGKAIYNILMNDSGVTALASSRIYFSSVEQGTSGNTSLVLDDVIAEYHKTLDGSTSYVRGSYSIACLSSTYANAVALAEAVIAALDQYSGTVKTINIVSLMINDKSDIDRSRNEGSASAMYGISLDFTYYYAV